MKTLVIAEMGCNRALDHLRDVPTLKCAMATSDFAEYLVHPRTIVHTGTRYRKIGWDSDRKIVHY